MGDGRSNPQPDGSMRNVVAERITCTVAYPKQIRQFFERQALV
jgi:hypothetical protein